MKIDWRAVLRDALGVLLLAFLGGLVGDAWSGGAGAASALLLMTAGFCVSGCLAKQARFKHLVLVASGVWLIGTVASAISTGGSWIFSLDGLALTAAAMLIGGLISLAIVKRPPDAPPPAAPPPAAPPPDAPPPDAPPPA